MAGEGHVSMAEVPRLGDGGNSATGRIANEDPASMQITLSELVSGIIQSSTEKRENDSNSLANAQFISNRTRNEAPRSLLPSGEDPIPVGPFDVDLDSTSETSHVSSPPFSYVSPYTCNLSSLNVLT